jgi:hypothetical protein
MRLVDVNFHPSNRQLRQFGLIALAALPLLGWFWGGGSLQVLSATAAAGAALAALGLVCPRAVQPVFLLLSLVTIPLGMILGELALLLLFYGLVVPLGLVSRLIGRDPLQQRLDRQASTYWQRKEQPSGPASYLRQW